MSYPRKLVIDNVRANNYSSQFTGASMQQLLDSGSVGGTTSFLTNLEDGVKDIVTGMKESMARPEAESGTADCKLTHLCAFP